MIALGWTPRGAAVPEIVTRIDLPGCAVVAVAVEDAASPAERLRLQVACLRRAETFLPVRPGSRLGLGDAVALGRRHGADLANRLADLRGLAQVSVRTAWVTRRTPDENASGGGRAWLAARAKLRSEEEAVRRMIAEDLGRIVAACTQHSRLEEPRQTAVQVAALCPLNEVDRTLGAIERRLGRSRWPVATDVALTGPWPPLAFARGLAVEEVA